MAENIEKSNSNEIKFEIKSMEDFKNVTWIEQIDWVDFKAFSTTKEELENFKNEIKSTIPERDKIEKIKAFLKEKAGLEVTTENQRQKLATELKEKTWERKDKLGALAQNEWVKKAVNELEEKTKEFTSKEWVNKMIWEWLNYAVTWVKEMISGFFEFLWNIPFFGWFFKALWAALWFWKKEEIIKEVWEKVTKIDEENIKKEIKNTIVSSNITYDEKILNEKFKNISNNDLNIINQKIKSEWKISLDDIKNLETFKWLFSKEWIKKALLNEEKSEKIRETLKTKFIEEIEKKYNKTLSPEKITKLEELIKDNLKINDAMAETIAKIEVDKKIELWEILSIFKNTWVDTLSFSIKLITNWIIDISDIWIDFVNSWKELISHAIRITTWFLWIENEITIDTFNKEIENLTTKEKAILLALLYRKWGAILNIVWNISAFVSRLTIESISNTTVNTLDAWHASFKSDHLKQAEQIEKIIKNLWWNIDNEAWVLRKAIDSAENVRKNYQILNILETNWENIWTSIKELKNIWIEIKWNPTTLSALKDNLRLNFNSLFNPKWFLIEENLLNKFWFWAKASLYEFNNQLEKLITHQRNVFEWRILMRPFTKINEFFSMPKLARVWEQLAFNFDSLDEAKNFVKKISIFWQKSPELIKRIFDKLPIFVVAWISRNSDKWFFEEFQTEALYLFPIVWPIMLLNKAWLDWKAWLKAENITEATIWWALLTMDWVIMWKEFVRNWLTWMWRYFIKPITDIYSIGRWTANFWYDTYKLAKAREFEKIYANALEKTKLLNWRAKAIAIAMFLIAWWATYAYASSKSEDMWEYFKDWKILDEKIKTDFDKISISEKEEIIKILYFTEMWENLIKNINFKIKWTELIIDSKNKQVQANFITTSYIKENLINLWLDSVTFNYYWQS